MVCLDQYRLFLLNLELLQHHLLLYSFRQVVEEIIRQVRIGFGQKGGGVYIWGPLRLFGQKGFDPICTPFFITLLRIIQGQIVLGQQVWDVQFGADGLEPLDDILV